MVQEIFQGFSGPMMYLDQDGTILGVNDWDCNNGNRKNGGQVGGNVAQFNELLNRLYKKVCETGKPAFERYMCQCEKGFHEFIYNAMPHPEKEGRYILYGMKLLNQAEKELMSNADIVRLFLEQFVHVELGLLAVVDQYGRYIYMNNTVEKIFGISREKDLGQMVGATLPEYRPLVLEAMEKQTILNKIVEYQIENEKRYFHITSFPIIKEGWVIAGASIGTDVTEKVLLEKKLIDGERMYLIGEMAARIMHDIRNPLQIVKSSSQLIHIWNQKGMMEKEKVDSLLANINTAVNSVVELMNDMLEFSKPVGEKKEKMSLKDLLVQMSSLFSSTINKYKIDFELDVSDECYIMGSKKKLRQAILNVVQNAFDVLQENSEDRKLVIRSATRPNGVVVEIFNSGPIIEENVQKKIFETFFSTKGKKGTGLGLAITKEIVEIHQGKIWCVSNNELMGTSFVFQFPEYREEIEKASQSV